jgi:hypothetical protein
MSGLKLGLELSQFEKDRVGLRPTHLALMPRLRAHCSDTCNKNMLCRSQEQMYDNDSISITKLEVKKKKEKPALAMWRW